MPSEHIVTQLLTRGDGGVKEAARLLRLGELVAIPTETVYGLFAVIDNPDAIAGIFRAKGRPQDNPLIVHIADPADLELVCPKPPPLALKLAERFWPGPLTMVISKSETVSVQITAGLNTVAVRCPAQPDIRAIIRETGIPLAGPSANISGMPSPTCAEHVIADLNGKIAAVFDGGECDIGLESTVLDLTCTPPRVLRPGGLPEEVILEAVGTLGETGGNVSEIDIPLSPGMKYRHYSPSCPVIILTGGVCETVSYIARDSALYTNPAVMCFEEEIAEFRLLPGMPVVSYGREDRPADLAKNLFSCLRAFDCKGTDIVYARIPAGSGLAAAVRNRLIKAAGGKLVNVLEAE